MYLRLHFAFTSLLPNRRSATSTRCHTISLDYLSIMSADLLSSLPSSLIAVVLGDYLALKDVVRLESAFCNHTTVQSLHEALRFPACVFSPNGSSFEGATSSNCMNWLVRRRAKVDGVCISDQLNGTWLHELIGISGPVIESVCFLHTADPTTLATAYMELQLCVAQLASCEFVRCLQSGDLRPFLAGMKKLKRLHLNFINVGSLPPEAFSGMACPDLKSLMITGMKSAFATIVHTILHLCLSGLKVSDDCAVQIARHCPNLTVLDLTGGGNGGDGGGEVCSPRAVARMCELCPLIEHLELETASDSCILRLEKLKLQTLTIKCCGDMSDTSTEAIIAYFYNTLTSLSLVNLSVRPEDMWLLTHHLRNLKRFEFGGDYIGRPAHLGEDFIYCLWHIETLSIVVQR